MDATAKGYIGIGRTPDIKLLGLGKVLLIKKGCSYPGHSHLARLDLVPIQHKVLARGTPQANR